MARIFLIHALRESVAPARAAMERGWPDAQVCNLLDDSLSADLARLGHLDDAMIDRFVRLGRYARDEGAQGILFTCSAFGKAIEAVKADLPIPVLKPNESAFRAALRHGKRIGLLVTFVGSLAPLSAELRAAAGKGLQLEAHLVEGALQALESGDGAAHDRAIATVATALPPVDAIVLGQFSMARAAANVAHAHVYTTPDAAVAELKTLVGLR
ncbi:MAG: arylsulfatase [Alphaproteobacteria bacterium]|nr:arylsulfatase [Alphaproteobacteria bacterium]MCA0449193.1 aspartate/glutamate racemase family protein [Pseudomonadota bacterium]